MKSVSCFARNALDCLESIRILQEYDVSVFFENYGINTQMFNSELVLYINKRNAEGHLRLPG